MCLETFKFVMISIIDSDEKTPKVEVNVAALYPFILKTLPSTGTATRTKLRATPDVCLKIFMYIMSPELMFSGHADRNDACRMTSLVLPAPKLPPFLHPLCLFTMSN